jgi:hypothetical protein
MNTILQLWIMDHKVNWWVKIDVSWNVLHEEECGLQPFES